MVTAFAIPRRSHRAAEVRTRDYSNAHEKRAVDEEDEQGCSMILCFAGHTRLIGGPSENREQGDVQTTWRWLARLWAVEQRSHGGAGGNVAGGNGSG